MAKKRKGRRRRPRLINRLINAGLLALAFKQPLERFLTQTPQVAATETLKDVTGGLSTGKFDMNRAMLFWGPVITAFVLFEVKKMAMRKFRI
jgi:hypothetical protein